MAVDEYHAMEKAIRDGQEKQAASERSRLATMLALRNMALTQGESQRLGQNDPGADTANTETPDPVSWSARFRGGFTFVLTNVSKSVTAYHVTLRSQELTKLPTDTSSWYWPEMPPKMTAEFIATPRTGRHGEPLWIKVIWEDEELVAHEESVYVVGL